MIEFWFFERWKRKLGFAWRNCIGRRRLLLLWWWRRWTPSKRWWMLNCFRWGWRWRRFSFGVESKVGGWLNLRRTSTTFGYPAFGRATSSWRSVVDRNQPLTFLVQFQSWAIVRGSWRAGIQRGLPTTRHWNPTWTSSNVVSVFRRRNLLQLLKLQDVLKLIFYVYRLRTFSWCRGTTGIDGCRNFWAFLSSWRRHSSFVGRWLNFRWRISSWSLQSGNFAGTSTAHFHSLIHSSIQ